jgi:hypothetical protein
MERHMRQAEDTTQKAYPKKSEQLSGTRHTQCLERGIFSSESAKGRHEKKNSSNKKSKPSEAVLTSSGEPIGRWVTRVNSTNVLDEGLRIGEIGRQMNSKVKSVKQVVYRK